MVSNTTITEVGQDARNFRGHAVVGHPREIAQYIHDSFHEMTSPHALSPTGYVIAGPVFAMANVGFEAHSAPPLSTPNTQGNSGPLIGC